MNGLEITDERRQKVRFTRPYYVYKLGLVTRKGEDRFSSLDELAKRDGLTVGTLSGSVAEEVLDEKKITRKSFDGQDQIYLDLVAKRNRCGVSRYAHSEGLSEEGCIPRLARGRRTR